MMSRLPGRMVRAAGGTVRPLLPEGVTESMRALFRSIPPRWRGKIQHLVDIEKEEAFLELAAELGVVSFTCEGELGLFEGYVRDRFVQLYYLQHRTYAPRLQSLLKERMFPGGSGTLIDVGANIGLTSIPLARVLRGVHCYAFEPDPENFRLLLRNITLNGVGEAVSPFNVALMSEEGQFELELSPENLGDHRIRRSAGTGAVSDLEGEGRRRTVLIRARRLDAMQAEMDLRSPVVLKTDTQGAEVRVLESASGILDRVDYVVAEYSPYLLLRMGDSPEAFFDMMHSFQYGALLDEAALEPPRLASVSSLITEMREKVPTDGTSTLHLDVLLSRTAEF